MTKHWAVEEQATMDLIYERMALLDIRGVGINEQVKQLLEYDLRITRTRVETWRSHPKYQDFKKKAIESAYKDGQLEVKKMAVDLLPLVHKCLEEKLRDGDIRAATQVLTIFTGEEETGTKQAQQLTVIMPGATDPKVVSNG